MGVVPSGHLPILECSECHVACVIRLCVPFNGDIEYLFQRDCKHKRGEIVMRYGETAKGPFRPAAD